MLISAGPSRSHPAHFSSLAPGPASESWVQLLGEQLYSCLGPILGPILVLLPSMPLAFMVTGWLIKAINQALRKFAGCLEFLLLLSSFQCRRPGSLGMPRSPCLVGGLCLLWIVPLAATKESSKLWQWNFKVTPLKCSAGQNLPYVGWAVLCHSSLTTVNLSISLCISLSSMWTNLCFFLFVFSELCSRPAYRITQ